MRKTIFLFLLIGRVLNASAQTQPDTTLKPSPVSPLRSMQYNQYRAYSNGIDINNLDTVALVNHYPTAQKVLADKKVLDLNPNQLAKLNAINNALTRKMKEMGAIIIKNETVIDSLFRCHTIDDGTLIFLTNRYGLYQAELRNAILQASLKTKALLDAAQTKKYQQLHALK